MGICLWSRDNGTVIDIIKVQGERNMDIRDRWISLLHRTATGSKKMRTLLTPKRKTGEAIQVG
jgi:hypothetical protein